MLIDHVGDTPVIEKVHIQDGTIVSEDGDAHLASGTHIVDTVILDGPEPQIQEDVIVDGVIKPLNADGEVVDKEHALLIVKDGDKSEIDEVEIENHKIVQQTEGHNLEEGNFVATEVVLNPDGSVGDTKDVVIKDGEVLELTKHVIDAPQIQPNEGPGEGLLVFETNNGLGVDHITYDGPNITKVEGPVDTIEPKTGIEIIQDPTTHAVIETLPVNVENNIISPIDSTNTVNTQADAAPVQVVEPETPQVQPVIEEPVAVPAPVFEVSNNTDLNAGSDFSATESTVISSNDGSDNLGITSTTETQAPVRRTYLQNNKNIRPILPSAKPGNFVYRRPTVRPSFLPSRSTAYQPNKSNLYQPKRLSSYQPNRVSSYQPNRLSSYQPGRLNTYQSNINRGLRNRLAPVNRNAQVTRLAPVNRNAQVIRPVINRIAPNQRYPTYQRRTVLARTQNYNPLRSVTPTKRITYNTPVAYNRPVAYHPGYNKILVDPTQARRNSVRAINPQTYALNYNRLRRSAQDQENQGEQQQVLVSENVQAEPEPVAVVESSAQVESHLTFDDIAPMINSIEKVENKYTNYYSIFPYDETEKKMLVNSQEDVMKYFEKMRKFVIQVIDDRPNLLNDFNDILLRSHMLVAGEKEMIDFYGYHNTYETISQQLKGYYDDQNT